jgi:hypothetical protein
MNRGRHALRRAGLYLLVLQQPISAAALKRSHLSVIALEPQPVVMTALPMAVWEDDLLPLLTCKDAARLGGTCKVLREVVRENFKNAGTIQMDKLTAALTTFPRVRTVEVGYYGNSLTRDDEGWTLKGEDVEALMQWLREGGRGGYLERATTYCYAADLFCEAWRPGAVPLLKSLTARLQFKTHRALLTEGLVAAMHELRVTIDSRDDAIDLEPQLAALGLVRQLSVLAKLDVTVGGWGYGEALQWPPFIPPPLRSLRIDLWVHDTRAIESFLCAFPGALGSSGARLDRLEIMTCDDFTCLGDGLVHLAQALRCCSRTLRAFYLGTSDDFTDWNCGALHVPDEAEDYAGQVEELRAQWGDLVAGVSACRELEVLVLPYVEVEPLFPPGTAFDRLTHLEVSDHEREHPPDACVVGLWELMASGGLPALVKLSVRLEGRWGGVEELRSRVAPALEAVAGTLLHLNLAKDKHPESLHEEVDVGYELGVAVGKLRRLKDLALSLSEDGRAYHALAQGLVVSGGDRPLPLLWRVLLPRGVSYNADQVVSLLLPSVRVFSSFSYGRGGLMTACALRQAGYKHTWATYWESGGDETDIEEPTKRVLQSIVPPCQVVKYEDPQPAWTMLPLGEMPDGV